MSTRLSKEDLANAQAKLLSVLDYGIKFLECPISDEDKGIFWHKGFPDDLLDAYTTLNEHGVGVEYSATTRAIGFVVPKDTTTAYAIRLCMVESQRGFFTITHKMMEQWPKTKLKDDQYTEWPVLTRETITERLGEPTAAALLEWVEACAIMDDEIFNAQYVIEEIFAMIKTAGQLKRMIPDLLQYLPEDARNALDEQKRTSQVPFEWAAYDRGKVERMLDTFHKCSLLKGLEKPSMAKASREDDAFSWSCTREMLADDTAE
jgi:hypothetical protein